MKRFVVPIAVVLVLAIVGNTLAQDLTQLMQTLQNSSQVQSSGQTSQGTDSESALKAKIKVLEVSFITFILNWLFGQIEQKILNATGTDNSTATATP